jgi:integrase
MSENHPTRERHVPQPKASHIYWSRRADGSKVFEVRHPRNSEGRRLYEVVGPRLDEAKARARAVYGDETPQVKSVGLTLEDVVADWQRTRNVRPASAEVFDTLLRLYIVPRFGRVKLREIDKNAIASWVAGLKGKREPKQGETRRELSPGTKRLILATLGLVLQHAIELGAIGVNPARQLGKRQRPRQGEARRRILTPDEETRLLVYCAPFPWLEPIITVALHEALRLGEVLGLQWEDVDFTANRLHVRHSLGRDRSLGPPKGGKAATIELTPAAREALLELRQESSSGFVFRNEAGGPRWPRDVQRAFSKARDRAALPTTEDGPVVFHSLRHTGISRLANHPAIPLVHVRDFARHADLATTQGYVHKIESATVTAAIAEALGG